MFKKLAVSMFAVAVLFVTSAVSMVLADDNDDDSCDGKPGYDRVAVSGSGIHHFDTVIVHRSWPTATGKRETTTETIDLKGDLEGRVLYQPRGVYNFATGKLVNTGNQVFSGTVLDSRPVMIFDDEFRFELDLNTGVVNGKVYLNNRLSGRRTSCELDIGNSTPPVNGKSEFSYTGECWVKKRH